MKTDELRQKYLDFFAGKGHHICASDVLVPRWDKTVLFTPAGMNPFKDHFLGKVQLEFTRATSCQKCLRTGDIDNVGRTAYHHTFFEMLGNFSFGDYFKREAIAWAWEFLTSRQWLGLDPGRLTVTVYLDDDEAADIWHQDIGLPESRIKREDERENFWPASAPSLGPDGVCGPCSEIYYHPPEGGQEVEIWNLVFTQFNRVGDPPGNLHPLPSKNIDTGMGLERTAAQLQGVSTNYHIDILKPIVLAAAEVCGVSYIPESDHGRRLRRITDHVRACTFAIHENVYPGSAKQEYVVRRLLRRAVLDGHQMGVREPFLHALVPRVVEMMRQPYPELAETAIRVAQVMQREEQSFLERLEDGLARIERIFDAMRVENRSCVDGREAAEMYQTYGVPPELFESIASERSLTFDWDGYRLAMEEHSETSGKIASGVMGDFGPTDQLKKQLRKSEFVGYETTCATTRVAGLIDGQDVVSELTPRGDDVQQTIVLEATPFYAEAGGQVGDTGRIVGPQGEFEVRDTQRDGDLILHEGVLRTGRISVGDTVTAEVDSPRRESIRRAHSATHVLHYALQKKLGSHAQQRGSKVADDWLRFDFANMSPVTPAQLLDIEREANLRIAETAPIQAKILPLAEARARGAMMLFGEKYPDPVRMISMGEFSRELCGGTHLQDTGQIGCLELFSEEGVSAGTRRIEALTGDKARRLQQQIRDQAESISRVIGAPISRLADAIGQLVQRVKALRKAVGSGKPQDVHPFKPQPADLATEVDYYEIRKQLRDSARLLNVPFEDVESRVAGLLAESERLVSQMQELSSGSGGRSAKDLIAQAEPMGGSHLIVVALPEGNPAILRELVDQVRSELQSVAVFLAMPTAEGKVQLVAGVTRDLIDCGWHAGNWIKAVAPVVGGGGGGKPDFAQAGGKLPDQIPAALAAAKQYSKTDGVSNVVRRD
mgnify:CR=1 FL=1